MEDFQIGPDHKESVIGNFSRELLDQNHLYVSHFRYWSKLETFYDQILFDLIQIVSFQPENKTLSQELREFSSHLQLGHTQEVKAESKTKPHPALIIVDTLAELLKKEQTLTQDKISWREKYIFFRLRQLLETFEQVQRLWNKIETRIQALHSYHENILSEKFHKAFEEWKEDTFQVRNHFVSEKSRWTFYWQEKLLRWDIHYKNFVQSLAAWTDAFMAHQRAVFS